MKILIDIGHPAHVHFFKNFVWKIKEKEHEILITARDKDVSLKLLDSCNFEYKIISKEREKYTKLNLFAEWALRDIKLLQIARKFNPEIMMAIGSPCVTHVGILIHKPSILFTDTEHVKLDKVLTFPFATIICTPSCFKKNLGKKQVRYNSYHELAYLHPNHFKPNPAVLDELDLSKNDKYIILRFVSWTASHDIGQHGIKNKVKLVRELEKYGQVFISSEGRIDKDLEKYRIKVFPEKLHDLLCYASLYIGEGATMATESAILGTPSIYVSSLIGTMGNFIELEQKYGLIFNYNDPNKAINKAVELIQKPNLKKEWKKKREKLLKDKIDVTAFMVWFVENYPESFREMKKNPEVRGRFRLHPCMKN